MRAMSRSTRFKAVVLKTVVVCSFMCACRPAEAEERVLTIGLIGDSTVATTYGWGPGLCPVVQE
jgi:hypothetical protein